MNRALLEIARSARELTVTLIFALAIVAFVTVLLASRGVSALQPQSVAGYLILHLATLVLIAMGLLLRNLWQVRPDRPLRHTWNLLRAPSAWSGLLNGLPMLLTLSLFMSAFSAMKSSLPLFFEYTWDSTWIEVDNAIHGGDPMTILQPVLGFGVVTSAFSIGYHLWVFLIFTSGIYFAVFEKSSLLKNHFFLAYFATWALIGMIMAGFLASVGPCFVEPIFGDHRFSQHMIYLRGVAEDFPVLTLAVQDTLLEWYQDGSHGLGRGISAMPSMHVAMAMLFFLAFRKVSRGVSIASALYVVFIVVASVHLAYHYAVDGYVAIAVTWLIWLAAGAVARRLARENDGSGAIASLA